MKRRDFLQTLSVGSLVGVAGCASSGPNLEFRNYVIPDPRVVSVDQNDEEYFGIIQNRGDEGSIRIELWYFENSRVPNPETAFLFQSVADQRSDQVFDLARSRFFSRDERREVQILAESGPPTQWDSFEFGIIPWTASYGAVFNNTGGSGEVEMRFEYTDTLGYNVQQPSNQLQSVGSDGTVEAAFGVVVPPGVEYEIVAEPV